MIDAENVVQSYATETEDGRTFFVHNFANEDYYMVVRDEDGITPLGRFDSFEAAHVHVLKILGRHADA